MHVGGTLIQLSETTFCTTASCDNSTSLSSHTCGPPSSYELRYTSCDLVSSDYHCLCGDCGTAPEFVAVEATQQYCLEQCTMRCNWPYWLSWAPTSAPTSSAPTSAAPTSTPSLSPTEAPTTTPSTAPTDAPTDSPSYAPTNTPTSTPTNAPTFAPTEMPSTAPTTSPSASPSVSPTVAPTAP